MIAPSDDMDRLMAVMNRAFDPAFGEAWNRRQVEDALMTGNCTYFLLAESGRKVIDNEPAVGFYLARQILNEMELLLLAVDPLHRRKGFAQILLDELCSSGKRHGVKKVFLEMRRDNPAEYLYRRHGFEPVGFRPKYYRMTDGTMIDAITFAREIAATE